jgi:hypothetical protein
MVAWGLKNIPEPFEFNKFSHPGVYNYIQNQILYV